MKRTFLRILPLAVAVLLATSCSKDENNDNAVVNNGQENVQTKTMPISITVNQKGLSKLTCANGTGVDLQPLFEPGDELGIYIKDGGLLKTLTVAEENITNGGKTAVFEGELDAAGLVDGETELTAKIGTQIDAAITAHLVKMQLDKAVIRRQISYILKMAIQSFWKNKTLILK